MSDDDSLGSIVNWAEFLAKFGIGESRQRHRKKIRDLQNAIRFEGFSTETEARLLLASDEGVYPLVESTLSLLKEWAGNAKELIELKKRIVEQQKEIADLNKELNNL